jgi:predicted DNA-binding ribbon-helix-helix protein
MSAEALGSDANNVGPINSLEPVFRVVSLGDRRRGLRLERLYWRLLDELASARGIKRSALLRELLEHSDIDRENAASVVRCYVASALETERNLLRVQADPGQIIALMQRAPVPAFAINRQKKLQQVNPEFMQLLRPADGARVGRGAADYVHLSLDTPIDELFTTAAAGHEAACGYQLQVDDRRRRGRAKMVLVPSRVPETLVGFVLT